LSIRVNTSVAIIMPALNEELAIKKTLLEIPLDATIVVIDNGSTDNTAEIARENGAIVLHEPRRGYGYACLAGINYLRKLQEPPNIVIFLDSDGADDPQGIKRLLKIKTSSNSPDIIMGSRLGQLDAGAMTSHSIIANKFFTRLIRIIYRVKLFDMGPLRIMDFKTLLDINMRDTGYGWTSEMIVKAIRKGYTIGEIPVPYRVRLGESKISGSVLVSLRAMWIIIHIFRHSVRR